MILPSFKNIDHIRNSDTSLTMSYSPLAGCSPSARGVFLEWHKLYHLPDIMVRKIKSYQSQQQANPPSPRYTMSSWLTTRMYNTINYTSLETYRMDIASPCLGLGVEVLDLETSTLIVGAIGGTCYFSIATAARHPHLHIKLAIGRSTKLLC